MSPLTFCRNAPHILPCHWKLLCGSTGLSLTESLKLDAMKLATNTQHSYFIRFQSVPIPLRKKVALFVSVSPGSAFKHFAKPAGLGTEI